MRVLIVDSDRLTSQMLETQLRSEGFNVYTTDTGEEGVDLAKIYDYDLILHDINLPDMSGIEAVRQIRTAGVHTPIMMVTGDHEIVTKTRAFGAGADDYLTKPFHKDELICRANAIIRRSKGHAQAIVEIGDVAINLDAKIVTVGGKSVHLTGKEYMMIELLALRLGQTITKEMFLNHLYGGMDEPELKIIDVFVCKVRKKLKDAGGGRHIETVWGRGYRLMKTPSGDDWKRPKALATQMVILNRLSHGQPETSGDVATHTRVEVTQIRPALSRLAAAGLVEMLGRPPNSAWRILPAGREAHTKETAAVAATA